METNPNLSFVNFKDHLGNSSPKRNMNKNDKFQSKYINNELEEEIITYLNNFIFNKNDNTIKDIRKLILSSRIGILSGIIASTGYINNVSLLCPNSFILNISQNYYFSAKAFLNDIDITMICNQDDLSNHSDMGLTNDSTLMTSSDDISRDMTIITNTNTIYGILFLNLCILKYELSTYKLIGYSHCVSIGKIKDFEIALSYFILKKEVINLNLYSIIYLGFFWCYFNLLCNLEYFDQNGFDNLLNVVKMFKSTNFITTCFNNYSLDFFTLIIQFYYISRKIHELLKVKSTTATAKNPVLNENLTNLGDTLKRVFRLLCEDNNATNASNSVHSNTFSIRSHSDNLLHNNEMKSISMTNIPRNLSHHIHKKMYLLSSGLILNEVVRTCSKYSNREPYSNRIFYLLCAYFNGITCSICNENDLFTMKNDISSLSVLINIMGREVSLGFSGSRLEQLYNELVSMDGVVYK